MTKLLQGEIHRSSIAMFTTKCHHSTWLYSSWQFPREAGNWCSSAWFNAGRSSVKIWFNSEILRRVVAASRGPQALNKAKAFFGKAIFQSKHSKRSRQLRKDMYRPHHRVIQVPLGHSGHIDITPMPLHLRHPKPKASCMTKRRLTMWCFPPRANDTPSHGAAWHRTHLFRFCWRSAI